MKKETKCLHLNTTQVGTETTAEVWCVDCNECIRTYRIRNINIHNIDIERSGKSPISVKKLEV